MSLIELVSRASNQPDGERYALLLPYLEFLDQTRFREYRPTMGADRPEFMARLESWLENVPTDEERLLLLEFVPEIFFATSGDFAGLYMSAVYGPVARWLVERGDLDLRSDIIEELVGLELGKTWFCPMTDSMVISEFYHVIGISGVEYRPDWRSLVALGAPAANQGDLERGLLEYIHSADVEYIVLMDDFVGTGSQVEHVVDFVTSFADRHSIPVLVLPLICHEQAVAALDKMTSSSSFVDTKELLVIGKDACLALAAPLPPDSLFDRVRDLICTHHALLGAQPFGFGTLGLAYVSYSNCPDNTVPLIHRHSPPEWSALFPRATR